MPTSVSHARLRLFHQVPAAFIAGAVAGTVLLICHTAVAATWGTALNELPVPFDWQADNRLPTPTMSANLPPNRLSTGFAFAPPSGDLTLSPAAQRVSQIASRYGDRDFLMVDKSRGKIILFANGRPVLIRPALTGESMADRIPADAWSTPWSQQRSVKFKVTPAGRFTVTRSYDGRLGELFDINELQGRDWAIAIHRVALGKSAERRDARLRSEADQDKHITEGCIDVDAATIAQLSRLLPSKGVPLYILPNDESLIGDVFQAAFRRGGPRS